MTLHRMHPLALTLLLVSGLTGACRNEPIDPRDAYTGKYSGTVILVEMGANPIDGNWRRDSSYAETVTLTSLGEDSLTLSSATFGERLLPFTPEEPYLITYGSHAAFSLRFTAKGDSLYLASFAYSGTGGSNYYQMNRDLGSRRQ
jgi:hypothetical protein